MKSEELFKAGQLTEAINEQLSVVKRNATDLDARFFLAELLCFQGDWERADKQLDVIVQHPQNLTLRAQLLRQLIRAETWREQVITEGRPPEVVVVLPPPVQEQLKLCLAMRSKQTGDYAAIIEAMDQSSVPTLGECNDKAFTNIEDLDDRFRGALEVMTANGKYFWIPWQAINKVQFTPAERPMDLIWRRALIDVEGGPKGESFVPVRYPLPKGEGWTDAHRLSRATDWQGEVAVTGIGQRMFAVDQEYLSVMEVKTLTVERTISANEQVHTEEEPVDPADLPTIDFVFKADLGSDN